MVDGQVPTAGVHRRRRIPLIWIVPVVTALIAGWLAWDTFSKRGPTITISFDTAAGLTAGQSQLKYKDVMMGTVKTITVSPDFTNVLVTVETVREAEPFLNDKTIFWVVKPELFAGNITGLETLLSGSYIGMLPSTEKGKAAARLHRQAGSAGPARRCPARPSSCETQAAAARSASARRSSSAISRSAPCWAGTSATWRAASPSTPSCARRSTNTSTTTRRSGTPRACR